MAFDLKSTRLTTADAFGEDRYLTVLCRKLYADGYNMLDKVLELTPSELKSKYRVSEGVINRMNKALKPLGARLGS